MTTTDRLPTPDLLAGHCVHGQTVLLLPAAASYCRRCVDLALSRTRDDGIEAAAQAIYRAISCSWCAASERDPSYPCVCTVERERVAATIRALKEDRPR